MLVLRPACKWLRRPGPGSCLSGLQSDPDCQGGNPILAICTFGCSMHFSILMPPFRYTGVREGYFISLTDVALIYIRPSSTYIPCLPHMPRSSVPCTGFTSKFCV